MDLSSFLTSLATSCIIFLLLMLLFFWLSNKPGNNVVYYPNRILKGLEPYDAMYKTRYPFTWIQEAFSSTEKDVISISGVDSAVYFVFLATALGILVVSGLVLLPLLLPLALTDKGKSNQTTSKGTFTDLDKLSMGNIKEKSDRLWAFVFAVYWVSVVTYYLLWRAYGHVSELRAAALMSPEVKPEQFAILVRDIPAPPVDQTRKKQVDSYFRALYPDTFFRSMVVTDYGKVNVIWKELEGYKKKVAHAEAVYAEYKEKGKPEGTRPKNRPRCCGLIGAKVDTIEYYTEKIDELTTKLEAEQKVVLREKQQASAFVFFKSRLSAASAAQNLHARMVDTWTVVNAPEPRQVIWDNLTKQFYSRQIRQYIVHSIVFLTIAFYMIPIGLVSAFTTLENLKKLLPFIKPWVKKKALRTVLEAYLPQLALLVFLSLLPKLLLVLSKAEGIPSESHAARAASGKYFYFSVFNVFIGVTLGGTLFSTFKTIQKSPDDIIPLLASSLPGNATFFLTFVALKFFVGYGLELSRIIPLIIFHLKRKYLCKTEAELKEAWTPGDLNYGTRIPSDLLILTIVFCYCVIAPIIIPFGVVYFGVGWLVFRNQVLKVFVPSYESYGQMWPHIHTRIVAALILFQVTMFGYFGVNKFYYTPVLIPLPFLSLIFAYICSKKFYRAFHDTALEVAREDLKEEPNMEVVFKSFIPPSLATEKADDDQSEDALSPISRSVSSA
ncbi:Early-responsive to dehydration stress protein (ERD4) [Heracleum sosnowskyi]|uniref:Early-responsive to dehydration stress protein (ERD4) n=1 Tax=Heracleum sosnowskyi TaxID=360622 RepID=A0AAD8HMT9_9APIA|nr:Early-responsive to dehydration stress protein (ERD4) [Heracleum sosnowskyi]